MAQKIVNSDLAARAQKLAEERERARTDKLFLANEVLGYTFQPDVHSELFDQFLKMDASKPLLLLDDMKNRLVLWARGHYKSTAATVEIIQLILNYPDIRIVIMRSTKEATQEWLGEILSHFSGEAQGSRLNELFPEFCGVKKSLKATADRFTVPARTRKQLREATVTTASATSNKTGKHFDVGFFDDLVTAQNYQVPKQLEKVNTGFSNCIPLIEPGGYKYVTGTRYAAGDLYEELIRKNINNTWLVSLKTCWSDDGTEVRFPQRVLKLPDGLDKVIGFTRQGLLDIMQGDPGMFSSQYLNRPAIEGERYFSEAMFRNASVSPDAPVALSSSILFIDLAATTGQKSDDSVILCGKLDHQGNIYLVDGIGDRWEPETLALQVIAMTVKHRPLKVMVENTASCKFFMTTLRLIAKDKGVNIPIDELPVNNKPDAKIIRVKSLSTYLTRGKLKIFSNVPCLEKLVSQTVNFTGDRHSHDDYPDTLALMTNYFSGNVLPLTAPISKNHMIEMLERDMRSEQMKMIQKTDTFTRYEGTMGDDFCC
jgi:predicted phage terminase large subunit-like protein